MDRTLTVKSGTVIGAIGGALISLITFIGTRALNQMDDLTSRVSKAESAIGIIVQRQEDTKERLQRIEDKLDKIVRDEK